MTSSHIQPCPVCNTADNPKHLFDKTEGTSNKNSISLYRCASCKTAFLGQYDLSYDDQLYAYYEKYKGKHKTELFDAVTRKSYLKVLALLQSQTEVNSILDVGCGIGDFVNTAVEEGFDAQGIELAKPAVEIAQEHNLPVEHVDFFSETISESSVDALTMFEVIEHLPYPVSFLKRAANVVKPGGLVYLTTPNFNSLDRRALGKEWAAIHREHLCYFTVKTLLNAVRKNTDLEVILVGSRNISEQLINKIRSKPSKQIFLDHSRETKEGDGSCTTDSTDLRTKIDKSSVLSSAKNLINWIVNATNTGSTIVLLLKRPQAK